MHTQMEGFMEMLVFSVFYTIIAIFICLYVWGSYRLKCFQLFSVDHAVVIMVLCLHILFI